eukprot:SAG11_NODE_1620_length_4569_cov_2.059955_7_plen_86_part_00
MSSYDSSFGNGFGGTTARQGMDVSGSALNISGPAMGTRRDAEAAYNLLRPTRGNSRSRPPRGGIFWRKMKELSTVERRSPTRTAP